MTKPILLSKDLPREDENNKATLHICDYKPELFDLRECFYNTKFVNIKNWFDDSDNEVYRRNYITIGDDGTEYSDRGYVYYIYDETSGEYNEYTLDNDFIDDCLDNYTDFVPYNVVDSTDNTGRPISFYNHDLNQDFTYYYNIKSGIKPFESDPSKNISGNTIQKTYCCLPPDLLYGCEAGAQIQSMFANSNIIGVIPRNLTKRVKKQSISNIFENVNIMPNLEYYYDENGRLDSSILNEVAIDGDLSGDEAEYKVVFRDKYGRLRKRKPVSGDRSLGQFVYVPAKFTECGDIMNAFNFRYNLPGNWNMPRKPEGHVGYYKTTRELNAAIENNELSLPYRSQYYFLTDESVKWDDLYVAKSVFISQSQDIDFSNKYTIGQYRLYYNETSGVSGDKKNAWVNDTGIISGELWSTNIMKNFYVDLNLCGKKNMYNMIEDYGCPIIQNKNVKLDNFVSDVLTIFLNGRVFYDEFEVGKLTTANNKSSGSSSIIGYYGFGKNIILPKFNESPLDEDIVFIPIDDNIVYYDFMVDNESTSLYNYQRIFAPEGTLSNGKVLFKTNYNKYTFK